MAYIPQSSIEAVIFDGTYSANVLNSNGSVIGQSALLTAGSGMTTATITLNVGNQNTAWFDMINYAWVSVEVLTNTGPVSLTFQTSGDSSQTNIRTTALSDSQTGAPVTSTNSAVGTFSGPRSGRYFRINSTAGGANTVTLVITFFANPTANNVVLASQQGGWSVGLTSSNASVISTIQGSITAAVTNIPSISGTVQVQQSGTWLVSVMSGNNTGVGVPSTAYFQGIISSSGNLTGVIAENMITDGLSSGGIQGAANQVYNGTNWDRARGNSSIGALVSTGASSVIGIVSGGLMPNGTSLNTFASLFTQASTTTVTASTAYISNITIVTDVGGTTSAITVEDGEAQPLTLVNGLVTTAAVTTPTIYNFQTPVKMINGIKVVTTGIVPASVSGWINYYQ